MNTDPMLRWIAYDAAGIVIAIGTCRQSEVAGNVSLYVGAAGYVTNNTVEAGIGTHQVDPATGIITPVVP